MGQNYTHTRACDCEGCRDVTEEQWLALDVLEREIALRREEHQKQLDFDQWFWKPRTLKR